MSAEVTYDSDMVKMANFVTLIKSCQSGSELFKEMFTLPNTGTGTTNGFVIIMNRVIKHLIQEQKITSDGVGCLTWNKCKKDGRDKVIEIIFTEMEVGGVVLKSIVLSILDPFVVPKAIPKKSTSPTEHLPRESTGFNSTGNIADLHRNVRSAMTAT